MEAALLSILFGLAAGARHAMEPDHLAAVSTLVARQRSPGRAFGYAATWGVGHAAVLMIVGTILLGAKRAMPPGLTMVFELGVAVMLVVLGVRSLLAARKAVRAPEEPSATHAHGTPGQPLLVGSLHGLAGSGALVAIAMTKATSIAAGLGFLLVYGIGATAGMAILAGVAGVPLARAVRHPRGGAVVLAVTGGLCVATGLVWTAAAGPISF
jgi:high-affinity nickel permease